MGSTIISKNFTGGRSLLPAFDFLLSFVFWCHVRYHESVFPAESQLFLSHLQIHSPTPYRNTTSWKVNTRHQQLLPNSLYQANLLDSTTDFNGMKVLETFKANGTTEIQYAMLNRKIFGPLYFNAKNSTQEALPWIWLLYPFLVIWRSQNIWKCIGRLLTAFFSQ